MVIAEKNGKMERDYDYLSKVYGEDLKSPKEIGQEAAKAIARMALQNP